MDAYNTPPWYYPMQLPHGMHQQHPPPMPHMPDPGPQGPLHPGMPMSPHTQSPSLPPSTLTTSDAVPSPHTPQPPPHSHQPSSNISISSPPPTPATSSGPGALLNTEAQEIVPDVTWQCKTIVIRRADGMEVSLEALKHSPQPSTVLISLAPPITTSCWTASVRIERKTNESTRSRYG